MTEKEYVDLFIDALKRSDEALVFEVDPEHFEMDEVGIYCKLSYQIDDRLRRSNENVVSSMKEILGDDYYISIKRMDAFPGGYAAYDLIIEK